MKKLLIRLLAKSGGEVFLLSVDNTRGGEYNSNTLYTIHSTNGRDALIRIMERDPEINGFVTSVALEYLKRNHEDRKKFERKLYEIQ